MGASRVLRRGLGAAALAAVAVALAWLLLGGSDDPSSGSGADVSTGAQATTTTVPEPAGPGGATTEELVDAAMLIGIDGTDLDEETRRSLERNPPGGVLIGAVNWPDMRSGAKLIAEIERAAGSRTLIATRQEGGTYRALSDLPPGQREIEIGDRADPEIAAKWAAETAKALADVGVDVNLAPVADVATLDSPIADRAFADNAAVVTELTEVTIEECERAGVACAPAHFPGLGGGTADTDQGPSSISLDLETLRSRDLAPFVAAFDAGATATVVSHGLYVAFDPVTPASLSPEITTGLLRDELGFEGAAISDDISAGAIGAFAKPGPAAVTAMVAGIDLVQVSDPADVPAVRKALIEAASAGVIGEQRLREAADRVAAIAG